MDKLIYALLTVSALLVLAFLALTANVVVYSNEPYNLPAPPEPTYLKEELPSVERLRSPRAVLVLDVSGSMTQTDRYHLETQAALRFYDVYLGLSREILQKGDAASIAIILFGTIPQKIDWTGSNDPWLNVSESNRAEFEKVVRQMLGDEHHEPRKASHTDYLLAIKEVEKLTASLDSPPLVLFLTDGLYDPHPNLARDVLLSGGANTTGSLLNTHGQIDARRILDGKLVENVQSRLPETGPLLSQTERNRYRESLRDAVDKLCSPKHYLSNGDQKISSLLWSPIYFGSNSATLQEIIKTLGTSTSQEDNVIHCRQAVDLVDNFVGILAKWFRLHEIPLAVGSTSFQIPPHTQAFALQLVTSEPVPRVTISHVAHGQPLSGDQITWAGVASGDGEWHVDLPTGRVAKGRIYLRPRYDWVLHVPSQISPGVSGPENIDIRLYLYSLESGRPISPEGIVDNLPASLTGSATLPNGERKLITLAKASGDDLAYQGKIPMVGQRLGLLRVELNAAELGAAIGDQRTVIKKDVQLKPAVQFILKNPAGKITPLSVQNIPESAIRFLQPPKAH